MHKGLSGVLSDLNNVVKISVVEFFIDHYLGDYTPYIEIVKQKGLNPEETKSLIKRGMIIISTKCNDCPCKWTDEDGSEIKGVQEIAVTPVDEQIENRNLVKWLDEVKNALRQSIS
ncbi:MAG: hypothetical protein R3321_01105 [Nitrososphaeraceae archaeon]|nr:hypothetical protein [Nitrososphaeraceae archaeon]